MKKNHFFSYYQIITGALGVIVMLLSIAQLDFNDFSLKHYLFFFSNFLLFLIFLLSGIKLLTFSKLGIRLTYFNLMSQILNFSFGGYYYINRMYSTFGFEITNDYFSLLLNPLEFNVSIGYKTTIVNFISVNVVPVILLIFFIRQINQRFN